MYIFLLKTLISGGQRKGWGDIYLYFGCRRSGIDDIYQQELAKAKDDGVIKEVHTALSREPEQPKVSTYGTVIARFLSLVPSKIRRVKKSST